MKALTLIVVLLLVGSAFGTTYTFDGKEDFGGTFSGEYDTLLIDVPGNYIELDSGIFTSSGANSYIDFGNDTIVYHTTQNTNNGSRIACLVQGDFSLVENIKIEAYQASTDSGGVGLTIGGSIGIVIDGKGSGFIHAKGRDVNSIYCDGAGKLKIMNLNPTNFCTEFTDRSYQRGYAIWLNDYNVGTYDLDSSYGYWVENIEIDSGRGGIAIVGNGDRLVMKHITGSIDAHNDLYDTLTSGGDTEGIANSFFLGVDNYAEDAWVVNCSLLTGTTHQGGRGISLNDHGPAGYYDDPSLIMEFCSFDVSSGYDDYFKWNYVGHALQSEEANSGVIIRDCYFKSTATATGSVTSYMGNRTATVYFGHSGTTTQFYRNHVVCDAVDGVYLAVAFGLDQNLNAPGGGTVNCYDNYFESPTGPVTFAAIISGGRDASSDCTFARDTIYRSAAYDDSLPGGGAIRSINSDVASVNNFFTDIDFLSADTSIYIQAAGVNKEIIMQKGMVVGAEGVDYYPVEGARIRVANAYEILATDTAGVDGTIDTVTLAYAYYHYGLADSNYNPFWLSAIVGADSATETPSIYPNSSQLDTINMSATAGYFTLGVEALISTGWTAAFDPDLRIPMLKAYNRNDTPYISMAQDANDPAVVYTIDSGSNWVTVDFDWDSLGGALHDHASFWAASDGDIHMVSVEDLGGLGRGYAVVYRRMAAPATQASDRGPLRIISDDWPSTGPRPVIYAGPDTTWIIMRSTVSGSFDSLWAFYSADDFATIDSVIYDAAASTGTVAHRMGIFPDGNGKPVIFRMKTGVGVIKLVQSATPGGFEGESDSLFVDDSGIDLTFERSFDACYTAGAWHFVHGRDDPTNDFLIHTTDYSGSLETDTISDITYTSITPYPAIGAYNNRLFVTYHLQDAGTTGPLVLKGWDSTNGWWNDSLVIGTCYKFSQVPRETSTDLGVLVISWVTEGDSLMFSKMTFDATAEESGGVGIGGAMTILGGVTIP